MTESQVQGGLYGLLIGDAVGVPYEFHAPQNLPPFDELEPTPPLDFRRAHVGVPPGTWSDDGAQALCLLSSLLDRGELDIEDLGQRLLGWLERGDWAVDRRVFDVGNQTSAALHALRHGVPADRSGPSGERDNGNGALMRVLPLALWHRGDDESLASDAIAQGLPTHGHLRSQLCCVIACLWARYLAQGRPRAFEDAVEATRAMMAPLPVALAQLDVVMAWPRPTGSGYVVDTLHSARAALAEPTYERVVKRAIAFGLDTDTTACVAGGLAGVRDGIDAIPARWRTALRGQELVTPLAERLIKRSIAEGA